MAEHLYINTTTIDTTGEQQAGTSEDIIIEKFTATKTINRDAKLKKEATKFPKNLDPSRYMALNFIPSDTVTMESLTNLISGDRNKFAVSLVKGITKSLYLPLPNNISEGISHAWSEVPTNVLKQGADMTNLGQKVQKFVAVTDRKVLNGSNLQTYSGTAARSFTFEYMLTPRNKEDADTLKEVLLFLKMHSSPVSIADGNMMTFPDMVNIVFREKDKNGSSDNFFEEVLQTTLFVIEGIQVNYSPDGNMTLFEDGTPKQVSLSITFKEFTPKLRGSWGKEETK